MTFILRPYQLDAASAPFKYWERGGPGHPLIEMATGTGKSAVAAEICRRLVQEYDTNVIVATHRKELIQQDADAIRRLWPHAPVGIFSAGLNCKRIDRITVGGIQSLLPQARKARMTAPGVVIIDECHLVNHEESTQYASFLSVMREENPDMRLIGLTATPYRLGHGLLTSGDRAMFSSIVYRTDVLDMVAKGFLSPLVTPAKAVKQINLDKVRVHAGEYLPRDMEMVSDIDEVNNAVARDVAEALAGGRTSAMVFGVTIVHCNHLAEALNKAGVNAQVVHGETSPIERTAALNAFKARQLACLVSCDLLTTGFDAPVVDVIAEVRATKSPGLHVQILGRGMRIAPGKKDALLLDYGGNVERHGPISNIRIPEAPKGEGAAPFKICPQCAAEVPAGVRICVHCDYEFPPPEVHVVPTASNADPMASSGVEEHEVALVNCKVHMSAKSGKNTLKVSFLDESYIPIVSEYVCLEHDGYARIKAEKWWRGFFLCPPPATCAEGVALFNAGMMRPVLLIETIQDGKYRRIKNATFGGPAREPGMDFDASEPAVIPPNLQDAFSDGDDIPF